MTKQIEFRKGMRLSTLPCCVAWIDLVGYGSMISLSGFRPYKKSALAAIERLRIFHEIAVAHAHRHFRTFVMNDGAAVYKDLSLRTNSVTAVFVARAVRLYLELRQVEADAGYPGARMVIAAGLRHRTGVPSPKPEREQISSIRERMAAGKLSAEQAVEEAWNANSVVAPVRDLQANFAFTKAYLADSGGSGEGISGANCYIDDALFNDEPCEWLVTDKAQDWRSKTVAMTGKFRKLSKMDLKKPITREGFRTGIDVFKDTSKEQDPEAVLRTLEEPATPRRGR